MLFASDEVNIAIPHMRVELGSKKRNLEKVRKVAQVAKEMGAQILLLPSMFNVGPADNPLFKIRISRKKIVESCAEQTAGVLREVSSSLGLMIVAGPIYERVGSKTYRTVLLVEPLRGIVHRARKLVTEEGATPINEAVIDVGLSFGILVEEDSMLPELSLYMILKGVDAILAFPTLGPEGMKQRLALMTRAMECRCMALVVGGIVSKSGEDLYEVPTSIINEEGGIDKEVRGMHEMVLVVSVKKSSNKRKLDSKRIKIIKGLRKLLTSTR